MFDFFLNPLVPVFPPPEYDDEAFDQCGSGEAEIDDGEIVESMEKECGKSRVIGL